MPTPEEYATMTIGRMRLGPALDSPGYRDLHDCIAAAIRAAVAKRTEEITRRLEQAAVRYYDVEKVRHALVNEIAAIRSLP